MKDDDGLAALPEDLGSSLHARREPAGELNEPAPAVPEQAPIPSSGQRGAWQIVCDKSFGPFFFGNLSSSIGIWLTNILSAILMYDLTRSATMVGAVSVAQFLPQTLLSPWAGALSDHFPRRMVLVLSKLLISSSLLVLALTIHRAGAGALSGGSVLIVAATFIGIGLAIANPAVQAIVPSLVPVRDLPVAMALNSTTAAVARAVGPALGALVYAGGGPALGYAVAAMSHLMFVAVLLLVRLPNPTVTRSGSIWAGFRYVWENREMRVLILGVAAIGLVVDPVITLTPPLADRLGATEALVGVLASTFGLGSFLSIVAFSAIRRRFGVLGVGAAGFFLLAAGNAMLVPVVSSRLSVVGMFIAGTGFLLATSSLTTQIQTAVPEYLRGRVMAVWGVAFLGTRPIAAATNGVIADVISVEVGFALASTLALAAAFTFRRRASRKTAC